ncbi:glycosyltransferase [Flavobacterium sp. GSB-24]|uniref:glycosyltransferase n=1 Tax=Flavobacterium sp. GSB-24 TaxID=2994319 RepID=UPI00248F65FB|nr:glycosyltransferase [Flavobacterium sp. GSB-24]BDU23556.1 glycosyl transferase [Flavobacterium sp. GSB-24]
MLAIIVPYYKISFFEATLESLANQTDKRFKAYIGNDSSPQSPEKILEKYQNHLDIKYVRFDNNLGREDLTKQWERCIELTNDETWIMILGDDDILQENVVESFFDNLKEIEKSKSNIVRFATQTFDNTQNRVSKIFTNPRLEKASESYYRKYLGLSRSSLSEYIFKKDVYLKYKFKNYPLAWHSDDYAWIEFAEDFPIYSINESVISITVSDESLTGMTNNLIIKNNAEIQFYIDLVTNKLKLFKRKQRANLLLQTEISLKKYRKITSVEWSKLSILYISNLLFFQFFKLVRRFIKSHFIQISSKNI